MQESDPDAARLARFQLQSVARSVLRGRKNPRGGDWRTVDCLRAVTGSEVGVLYSSAVQRAHFSGVATCGSVWACPVCSAKVSERRKAEIVQASDLHKSAGGGLYMVTLTWAHSRHDDLSAMVKGSREALTKLRKHRDYKDMLKRLGYVGMVRAFEVTHGDANGWHPHFHELWFTSKPLTRAELRRWQLDLYQQWELQCVRAGLGRPNRKAGLRITSAESAAEYIAKFGNAPRWGVGSELTKRHAKTGKEGSRTPWDLLRLAGDGQRRFAALFETYVSAFFGARQVFWSPGLKKVFGIDEVTDEELAARSEEDAKLLLTITKPEWRQVLAQPYEARFMILRIAESLGCQGVRQYLSGLSPGLP